MMKYYFNPAPIATIIKQQSAINYLLFSASFSVILAIASTIAPRDVMAA
jgi:hypothetical protein